MTGPTYAMAEPPPSVFTTGPTFAELDAQLVELQKRYAPLASATLALATMDDVHRFRNVVGAGPHTPPWQGSIGPLLGIPIIIDKDMPEGVMELRTGTTVRRITLYGDALTREREATLARFLTTAEDAEDAADEKPGMEAGCLRTGYGICHRCKVSGLPIFRYELDPRHRTFLACTCTEEGDICFACFNGVADLESTDMIACGGCFTETERCTWSEWLDGRALPWLCPACWKTVAAEEISHIQALEAANPF